MVISMQAVDWAIEAKDMRVDYGETVAVRGLTMQIPFGEVYGLVGANGAGKTSTFSVWATLRKPTYGQVKLAGYDLLEDPQEARKVMAYMPDLAPVPSDLKVWEFLDMFARCYGLAGAAAGSRWHECLELVDLLDKKNERCSDLSRGMKQRVNLAKAILHRPKVLILDEPASGMDPASRAKLRDILKTLAAQGATVVISSHILNELSDMCSSVGILHKGELVDDGAFQAVVDRGGGDEAEVAIMLADRSREAEMVAFLESCAEVFRVERKLESVVASIATGAETQAAVLAKLVGNGFPVRSYSQAGSGIERRLLDIYES